MRKYLPLIPAILIMAIVSFIPHIALASVDLRWDADDTNVSIYRGSSCLSAPDPAYYITTVQAPTHEYNDTTVVGGMRYSYTLFAVSDDGSYSDPSCISSAAPSNIVSSPPSSPVPPNPPQAQVTDAITTLVLQNKALFLQAEAAGISLPAAILSIIHGGASYIPSTTTSSSPASATSANGYYRDLGVGMSGGDVAALQTFLIKQNKGPEARALRAAGASGYFGSLTKYALAEYQYAVGIVPSTGYFGGATRARVQR